MRCPTVPFSGVLSALLAFAPTEPAPAVGNLVISQVWGGTQTQTGIAAQPRADFIELFNRTAAPISISGWSIAIDAPASATWRQHNLPDATIPPRSYYLIRVSPNADNGLDLPPPDTVFATPVFAEISALSGKVALRRTTTPLGATVCPLGQPTLEDLVVYGTSGACFEGAGRAPAGTSLGAGLAIYRAAGGCVDTDDNAADFAAAAPAPRSSATPPPAACIAGACCHDTTGACLSVLGAAQCPAGSSYLGDGVACAPTPCPPVGACCAQCTYTCTLTTAAACGPGSFWVALETCAPAPCVNAPPPANDRPCDAAPLTLGLPALGQLGSATLDDDGIDPTCISNPGKGVWYTFTPAGTGYYRVSTCGAPFDSVLTVFAGLCFDVPGFVEQSCDDDGCIPFEPSPPVCGPTSSRYAARIPHVRLEAGMVYLVRVQAITTAITGGTFPIVVESAVAGACCNPATGACVVSAPAACTLDFRGEGSVCPPEACNALGACCRGSTCTLAAPLACTGPNTRFAGPGLACNTPGATDAPCCLADHNQSGSVTVQDIFDYLAAYFTLDPAADVNASGSVTVQDIFDYLAAYFAQAC